MMKYKRHDMLEISLEGRARIFYELIARDSDISADVVKATILAKYGKAYVPGIVRRGELGAYDCNRINIGFVYPAKIEGNRIRLASVVDESEVLDIISPYILLHCDFEAKNKCMTALKAVARLQEAWKGHIGVVGSAALEIVTGCCYTDNDSDLDIVLKDQNIGQITETYTNLLQIGQAYKVKIDAEIQLSNGYGIKAEELFIGSQTLLGKSLFDVQLLERKDILKILN